MLPSRTDRQAVPRPEDSNEYRGAADTGRYRKEEPLNLVVNQKMHEESGYALGIFCSVGACQVCKELIHREMSLSVNRGNWKPCCGRVISVKQQHQLCLWERKTAKGLLIYSS